jgi:hypothetical protein
MANKRLVLARTDIDNLMGNLRGEVGEVITSWLLMRHFISVLASAGFQQRPRPLHQGELP